MRASHEVSTQVAHAAIATPLGAAPDRVYVRRERHGRIVMQAWGIEHGGLRCEVVEAVAPGRPCAAWAIERDLRRGVGLF